MTAQAAFENVKICILLCKTRHLKPVATSYQLRALSIVQNDKNYSSINILKKIRRT